MWINTQQSVLMKQIENQKYHRLVFEQVTLEIVISIPQRSMNNKLWLPLVNRFLIQCTHHLYNIKNLYLYFICRKKEPNGALPRIFNIQLSIMVLNLVKGQFLISKKNNLLVGTYL